MPESGDLHYIASAYNPVRFWLYIDQNGYVNFDFDRYTAENYVSRVYLDSNTKIGVNEWKHVAATINITSGEAKIYIDGNLDLTQSFTIGSNGLYNNDCCRFYIGGYIYDTSNYNFDGRIDEVRLTKKALTTSQFILGAASAYNASFSISASDSDGSVVNYTWNSDVDGIIGYNSFLSLNVTSRLSLGYHNVTVKVTDNEGNSVTSSATMIRIKGIPVVNITSITPNALLEGTSVSLTATAIDIDGSIAGYQWKSDLDGLISTSKDFSITTLSEGYHNITFRAKDMDGYWSLKEYEHVLVTGLSKIPEFGAQGSGFYDFAFSYKREISLSSATSIDNTTIQIIFDNSTFDYQYANQSGNDIRFYDSALTTKFHYWIEDWNYDGQSNIWVRIPDSGTSRFYLAYGSEYVVSESNASNTFEFFDDFNDGSLDSTLWEGDTGDFTECNGYLFVGSSCNNGGYGNKRLTSIKEWTGSYVIQTKIYVDYTEFHGFQAVGWYGDTCNNIGAGFRYYDIYVVNNNDCYESSASWSYADDWIIVTLTADGSNSKITNYNTENDNYYNWSIDNSGLNDEVIALGRFNCECFETSYYRAFWIISL